MREVGQWQKHGLDEKKKSRMTRRRLLPAPFLFPSARGAFPSRCEHLSSPCSQLQRGDRIVEATDACKCFSPIMKISWV